MLLILLQAVEAFSHDLLWDGPPIRLSNKGHLRLASYLFKYFAHLRIIPTSVIISEPAVGKTLLEVDAVAVSYPHRCAARVRGGGGVSLVAQGTI